MTVVCPNCEEETEARVVLPRPGEMKETHCNICYTWFMVTKEGKGVKKPALSTATQVRPQSSGAHRPTPQTPQRPAPPSQAGAQPRTGEPQQSGPARQALPPTQIPASALSNPTTQQTQKPQAPRTIPKEAVNPPTQQASPAVSQQLSKSVASKPDKAAKKEKNSKDSAPKSL